MKRLTKNLISGAMTVSLMFNSTALGSLAAEPEPLDNEPRVEQDESGGEPQEENKEEPKEEPKEEVPTTPTEEPNNSGDDGDEGSGSGDEGSQLRLMSSSGGDESANKDSSENNNTEEKKDSSENKNTEENKDSSGSNTSETPSGGDSPENKNTEEEAKNKETESDKGKKSETTESDKDKKSETDKDAVADKEKSDKELTDEEKAEKEKAEKEKADKDKKATDGEKKETKKSTKKKTSKKKKVEYEEVEDKELSGVYKDIDTDTELTFEREVTDEETGETTTETFTTWDLDFDGDSVDAKELFDDDEVYGYELDKVLYEDKEIVRVEKVENEAPVKETTEGGDESSDSEASEEVVDETTEDTSEEVSDDSEEGSEESEEGADDSEDTEDADGDASDEDADSEVESEEESSESEETEVPTYTTYKFITADDEIIEVDEDATITFACKKKEVEFSVTYEGVDDKELGEQHDLTYNFIDDFDISDEVIDVEHYEFDTMLVDGTEISKVFTKDDNDEVFFAELADEDSDDSDDAEVIELPSGTVITFLYDYKLAEVSVSKTIDDYTITVEGTIPEVAEVKIEKLDSLSTYEDLIVNKTDLDKYKAYVAFDIGIMIDDEEWQPEDFSDKVKVSIENDTLSKKKNTKVFRVEAETEEVNEVESEVEDSTIKFNAQPSHKDVDISEDKEDKEDKAEKVEEEVKEEKSEDANKSDEKPVEVDNTTAKLIAKPSNKQHI